MNKEQLRKGIIAATEIIQQDSVFIIGSQAILASYDETVLPEYATLSRDLDVLPKQDFHDVLSDMLHGEAGMDSEFDAENNFYLDGVSEKTAILPKGWEARTIKVEARKHPKAIGWCLDKHDLCVAKLAANRDKDRKYVRSLIDAELVDPIRIRQLIGAIPADRLDREHRRIALNFIQMCIDYRRPLSNASTPTIEVLKVVPESPAPKPKRVRCRAKDPENCTRHTK